MTSLWLPVLVAFLATVGWRALGVVLGDRLPEDSLVTHWVNALAYAMVSGVMMLVVIFPSGLLAESSLEARLTALFLALAVMLWARTLLVAALAGLSGYLAVTYLLPL